MLRPQAKVQTHLLTIGFNLKIGLTVSSSREAILPTVWSSWWLRLYFESSLGVLVLTVCKYLTPPLTSGQGHV